MLFFLRNVTYLLDITPSYPLSFWPPPIPLHVIQVNTLVAKQLPINHDKKSGRGCFRNNAWHTIAWGIPYSGKLSREKTFANFMVMWHFTKVFSAKFGAVGSFGLAKASNPRKFSPRKSIFHQFVKVFSFESFPRYSTLYNGVPCIVSYINVYSSH